MKQELHIEQALEWFDFFASQVIKESDYKGFSISFAKEDKIVFSKAYGENGNIDLQDKDMFRMASHSKNITAISIMKLVEEEKLSLDDKVVKYLDFFNPEENAFQNITIRQLLNHSAGIKRDGDDSGFWELKKDFPNEKDLKKFFKSSKIYCETNTRLKYSNLGYGLLGLIIEKVTELNYNDYIHQNILKNYDMFMDSDFVDGSKIAKGYISKSVMGKIAEIDTTSSTKALSAATGLVASTKEMAEFYQNLYLNDESLITDESKKELFKPNFDMNEHAKVKYGLGFRNKSFKGFQQLGHTGGFPGHISATVVDPKKQMVISCAVNSSDGAPLAIVNAFIDFINKFESKKDKLIIENKYNYKKLMTCLWGSSIYIPFEDEVLEIGTYFSTMDEPIVITKQENNSYLMTSCSTTDSYNEEVEFFFDKNNVIKTVNRAGNLMVRKEDFKL